MEIDCTGTIFARYFGKAFNQVSFGCPDFFMKKSDNLVKQYNRKPSKYRKTVNDVVKDVRGRVSHTFPNLAHRNEARNSQVKPSEIDVKSVIEDSSHQSLEESPSTSRSESDVFKTGLYYLGAGVGALGVGALASVGLIVLGTVGCSVFCIEKLLCVDPEYQKELKALEVENVYRPDINNVMYEYRSPYRY